MSTNGCVTEGSTYRPPIGLNYQTTIPIGSGSTEVASDHFFRFNLFAKCLGYLVGTIVSFPLQLLLLLPRRGVAARRRRGTPCIWFQVKVGCACNF